MDLRILRAELRLTRPVRAADVEHARRTSLFLELRDQLHTGMAELPLEGRGLGSERGVVGALRAWCEPGAEARPPRSRAAAQVLEDASLDLALRRRGRSLADTLGATVSDVGYAGVVGIAPAAAAVARAEELVAAGASRLRVKIAPGHALEAVRAVLAAVHVPVVADANASFDRTSAGELDALAELPLAWLEEPFAPDEDHALLERLAARGLSLGADESAADAAAVERLADAGVVAVVCVKPARLGVAAALDALEAAERRGLSRYVGGYFEAGLGRAVLGALAAVRTDLDGDVVAPVAYLEHDPCGLPGPVAGRQPLHLAPGLGPLPDPDDLAVVLEVRDVPRERLTPAS